MAEGKQGRFELARLALSQLQIEDDGSLDGGLEAIARISSKCLGVERVGFWAFEAAGARIDCIFQFDARSDRENVAQLWSFAMPSYLRALRDGRFVVADDARTHPATRELTTSYLEPLGITSMLDAPVYRGKELIGIVCHEHTGAARNWTVEEQHLAATAADVVALLCEQARRLAAERRARAVEGKQRELALLDDLVRVSAGVAHDVNNLLATVIASAALLERRSDDPEFVRSSANELALLADQGARLVQLMVTLRRSLSPPAASIDLVYLCSQLEPVLSAVAGGRTFALRTALPDAWVLADPRSIEQVLFNLVTNARDASTPGSLVEVSVTADDGDGQDWVALGVRDEGSGMHPKIVKRVTEPFFTTRESKGGSGLGLDIVATIARQHGGKLRIDSKPDRGTLVEVLLPRVEPS